MKPVVLALASNESYFAGLYCAIASALGCLDAKREVDLKVLDGGITHRSRKVLSDFVSMFERCIRLEFVPVDEIIFGGATPGPGQSHMAYCRILLPQLISVPRLIYLDCDVLVFRDLSQLFDFELSAGKCVAAVPDSETCSLAHDSHKLAKALKLPGKGAYFNSGVMLMNLDELRKRHFFERAVEFLTFWKSDYRFHDQSAINFLLHEQIDTLPEYWNRPAWCFDAQRDNDLNCVLHYTMSVPWLGGPSTPSQVLFEKFAEKAALPVNRKSCEFKRSVRRNFWRNVLAPLRAIAFPIASLLYKIAGRRDKSAAYEKVARHWRDYVFNAPSRRRLYRQRNEEITRMKLEVPTSLLS
jgi:lipopolysaccharide biosynthesis glycosyltransferase